jgi:hypothetical protein
MLGQASEIRPIPVQRAARRSATLYRHLQLAALIKAHTGPELESADITPLSRQCHAPDERRCDRYVSTCSRRSGRGLNVRASDCEKPSIGPGNDVLVVRVVT